jgi:hypothetical protein
MGPRSERRLPRAHKPSRPRPHAEFRHRAPIPRPAVAEVEPQLVALRSPSVRAPRQMERRAPRQPPRVIRLRQRLVPLPVMVAMVVSLGWRRMPAVTEGPQVLARDGWLGVMPVRVRLPARTTRLAVLPAAVRGPRGAAVCARWRTQGPPALPAPPWAPVPDACSLSALVDGSTLAARRNKTHVGRQRQGLGWGGTRLGMGEACSHRPLRPLSPAAAAAHDQRVVADRMAARPIGGLWGFALGLCSVLGWDDVTDQQTCLLTRLRAKTA